MYWPIRDEAEPLADTTVHVWAASLDVPHDRLARLATTLSDDERRRASVFRRDWLTARYVAGRGQLRELLGAYLKVPAAAIEFAYDDHGKPRIAHPDRHPPLQFNVSHSGGLALYAVSNVSRLGVDVEEMRPFADMPAVARHNFSAAERSHLDTEPPESYVAGFYRCWTRKEAYLKAIGIGLFLPLDSFDVSVAAHEPAALLRADGDDDAPRRWAVVHLEPGPTAVGAVVVETPRPDVRCWRRP